MILKLPGDFNVLFGLRSCFSKVSRKLEVRHNVSFHDTSVENATCGLFLKCLNFSRKWWRTQRKVHGLWSKL